MIDFGPELVGRTEKSLGALLRRTLADTGLTEQQYITLKVASALGGADELIESVRARAHFADAEQLAAALTERALLNEGRLSAAGATVLDQILRAMAGQTATIWTGLPDDEVAATTRVLNAVLARAESVLST